MSRGTSIPMGVSQPPIATAYAPGAVPSLGGPNGAASLGSDGKHVTTQYNAVLQAVLATETVIKAGANLTDADATVQPFTDKASQYTMPLGTQTANRITTLGSTSATAGAQVRMVQRDRGAYTWSIGSLFTFPANLTVDRCATFQYNGSYWVFLGWEFIQ